MSTSNDSLYDPSSVEISLPRPIRFWFLLLLDLPSVCCTIFMLYHMFADRALRRALHNHVIIALLITGMTIQLMDVPIYLTFIQLSHVWPQTRAMCFFWWYVDVGICFTTGILVAWASIERHILIFHDKWVSTRTKTFLVHYMSLFAILIYSLGFYLLALLIPPCDHNSIDYTLPWCHYSPCYYTIPLLHYWDVVVNRLLPSLLIAIFSIVLLCRILWQKHSRWHRPIVWRKHRKMTVQLVSLSGLYLIFGFPLFLVQLCSISHVKLNPQIQFHLYFLSFLTILSLPFVCFISLPTRIKQNTWKTLIRRNHLRRNN